MIYGRRFSFAVALSILAHMVVMLLWPTWHETQPLLSQESSPISVRLIEEPHTLVEIRSPSNTPPDQTNLIALEHSRASDTRTESKEQEETPGPSLEDASFDSLSAEAVKVPALEADLITPHAEAAKPQQPVEPPVKQKQEQSPETDTSSNPLTSTINEQLAAANDSRTAETVAQTPDSPPTAEELLIAQEDLPRREQARPRGRTVTYGMTNFEALRHEIAPYLEEVKKQVERRWIEMLLLRYTGTSPTRAEVFCAIAPDGTLVEVSIIGTPADPLFAALCSDAIKRAGPFKPFSFETPAIYRNQNLEIGWSFNFL